MGDLTTNLSSYEYLPQREYTLYKAGKLPQRTFELMIRLELYRADQKFIDRYGSTFINTYLVNGGSLQFCGFRPADCKEGATYGDHRFGGASDKHPQKVTIAEVFADFKANPQIFIDMGYRTIELPELTPDWFHGSIFQYAGQVGLSLVGLS